MSPTHATPASAERLSNVVNICIVGSRYFGVAAFEALRNDGVDIAQVVVPAADDRLAQAAQRAGVPVHVLADPKIVPGVA
jgi:hypothetical protein